MEKRAHGNRLHCQTPSSAPSQSQPFLLGIATLPHFVLVRDSTPYKYPYISRSSRREAESEKNLRSGKKILASRISNPYFEAVSRPKNERQIRNTNPVFVTHLFILFAHTNSRVGKSHQIRISKPGMRHILFLSFYAKRRGGPLANAPPRLRI